MILPLILMLFHQDLGHTFIVPNLENNIQGIHPANYRSELGAIDLDFKLDLIFLPRTNSRFYGL